MGKIFSPSQIKDLLIPQIKKAFRQVDFLEPWFIRPYLNMEESGKNRKGAIDAIRSFHFRMSRIKRKKIPFQTPHENLLDHYRETLEELEDLEEYLAIENKSWDRDLSMGRAEGDISGILKMKKRRDELFEKRKDMESKHDWLISGIIPGMEVTDV